MPTTTKGVPYPSPGAPPNIPAIVYALAEWVNDHFGGDAMTEAERDALTDADLWDGRLIRNTTSGDLELYDLTAEAWVVIATSEGPQLLADKTLRSPRERVTVQTGGMGATVNFDVLSQGTLLYAGNSTADSTLNVRGSSTVELDDVLAVGDAVTVVLLVTNGATARMPTVFQVDGTPVTPKWAGGAAPGAGSSNAIDAYSLTLIKTAAATYTVLASAGRYA